MVLDLVYQEEVALITVHSANGMGMPMGWEEGKRKKEEDKNKILQFPQ